MIHLNNRLDTFKSWENKELALKLAMSGFVFTGDTDIAKCIFCNIEIKDWDLSAPNQEPKAIHKKMSRFCPMYLYENFTKKQDRLETFKTWTGAFKNTEKLAASGFVHLGYKNVVQCYSCKIKLGEWDEKDDPFIEHKRLNERCLHMLNMEKQKNHYICDICLDREKNTCFLPCAHVVCCIDCCANITEECPVCKTIIEQKIRIFL